jgi:hypothetical protein
MNLFIAFSLAAACGAAMNSPSTCLFRSRRNVCHFFPFPPREQLIGREGKMPVLILWAVPAILVVGGGISISTMQ